MLRVRGLAVWVNLTARRWLSAAVVVGLVAAASPLAADDDAGVRHAVHTFALDAARRIQLSGDAAYIVESTTSTRAKAPDVSLRGGTEAFTDCSGWVSYVLSSVSPLHQSVLARHRLAPKFNHGRLDEASYAWPRAAVVRDFLAAQPTGDRAKGGFRRVTDFRTLAPGDIVAWCLGEWCDPKQLEAPPEGDTGHTFIVIERPVTIQPTAGDYVGVDAEGQPTLDTVPGRRVASVIGLGVIDSSSIRHFADDRDYTAVPANAPKGAVPGGVGRGRIWIAVDAAGRPVQFRFSRADPYFPNPGAPQQVGFSAGRPWDKIAIGGDLTVARYANATSELNGMSYGAPTVALAGRGTLTIASGSSIALVGNSRFRGPVVVLPKARLRVSTDGALGSQANPILLRGRLVLSDGFIGSARRTLTAKAGAVLQTTGTAAWRGPLRGRRLDVIAARKLRLERLDLTIRGRKTVRIP